MALWNDFGFVENPYEIHPLESSDAGSRLLVGRDTELERLIASVTSLDLHSSIEGPNGVGKTSLVAVARHQLTGDRTNGFFLDLGSNIELQPDLTARQIERQVAFHVAQCFIRHADDLRSAGISAPDVSAIDRWLNLPVDRSGSIGFQGTSVGFGRTTTHSQGFDEAGFLHSVRSWLQDAFPSRTSGGVVAVIDNLEVLRTSDTARQVLEELRNGVLDWPGMRWILVGARGIVRTVLSSPRLQGYIADPLELLPVSGDVVAEIVSKRIEEFRFDDETYVPVEPMDFGDLVALFRGDLRAAFKLCQEYSLELAGGSWPEGDHKREALNDYVDRVAQRHYIALDGISERGRRLFADICSIGGLCSAADHLAVGFNDAEGLGKEIEPLLRYQLLTEAAVAPDHPDLWLVTSKGWLVFREF